MMPIPSQMRPVRALVRLLVLLALALSAATFAAHAVEPDEILADARLEARARALSAGLRCLVCQNQSIDDSNAPLARDLRLLVRERLKAGDTDAAVEAFVVRRYGEFVLLRPPLGLGTALLWLAPLLLLAGAVWLAFRQFASAGRRSAAQSPAAEPPLSPDEARRLAEILKREP